MASTRQRPRLLIWLGAFSIGLLVLYLLVLPKPPTELPARQLEDCPAPPEGFSTAFCGHDLMAVELKRDNLHEVRVMPAHSENLVLADTSHTWINL